MKSAIRLAFVLQAVAISHGFAQSQPADTQAQAAVALTLDEAIARGLAASHRLAEATARGEAAEAVTSERRAAMRPQLAAQAGDRKSVV